MAQQLMLLSIKTNTPRIYVSVKQSAEKLPLTVNGNVTSRTNNIFHTQPQQTHHVLHYMTFANLLTANNFLKYLFRGLQRQWLAELFLCSF